ncbi:MAG: hypothetical protein Q8M09_12280 [Pseudomonadota bacterium]|nr:hypothetical protein [Pseudomonadota bacterium]MDP2351592.1 hypothetical protein [Pseudomonadota bacterium]
MRPETILKTTKALHISWALFVSSFWLFGMSEIIATGNIFLPIQVFAPSESLVGFVLGAAFCLAPFLTLLVLFKNVEPLFIYSVMCNVASMIYGVIEFASEANLNNAMILLAIAGPLLTIVASVFGIRSLLFVRQLNRK